MKQPPAFFHPRILVGPGAMLRYDFVLRYNITHVINCATEEDSPDWWRAAFPDKYLELNAIDSRTGVNILDWYAKFEQTMQRFLRDGDGVVYVHCQAGMNRSASLALAYCCVHFHMGFDSLVFAVKRQRPCILQNTVFMDQVKEFVNGRIQSEKTERNELHDECDRNVGLFASRHRSDSEGVQDDAGDFEERSRDVEERNRGTPAQE